MYKSQIKYLICTIFGLGIILTAIFLIKQEQPPVLEIDLSENLAIVDVSAQDLMPELIGQLDAQTKACAYTTIDDITYTVYLSTQIEGDSLHNISEKFEDVAVVQNADGDGFYYETETRMLKETDGGVATATVRLALEECELVYYLAVCTNMATDSDAVISVIDDACQQLVQLKGSQTPEPTNYDEVLAEHQALFPDFELTVVMIEHVVYYKFQCQDAAYSDYYLLLDEKQEELILYRNDTSLSIAIYNILGTETDAAGQLVLCDVTSDGVKELIVTSSSGGTGANGTLLSIVNLQTMQLYEVEDFILAAAKQITVTPKTVLDTGYIECEVMLGEQSITAEMQPLEKDLSLDEFTYDWAKQGEYFWVELVEETQSFDVHLGIAMENQAHGFYLCWVDGRIAFCNETNSFVLQDGLILS